MEFVNILIYISIYLGLIATTFYILTFISRKEPLLEFKDDELPTVSIIIPVHNEEKSIENTLNSILGSDYPKNKLEIVVVDDGSSDNTLKIAEKFKDRITIFSKKNGGKATALNFALARIKSEIVFSMDADTLVERESVKKMVRYFKNKQVMCVTPGMTIHNPKGILQRIQSIEYLTGIFLRKTFSNLNAIHITPGAFSAYRKSFFDKYGGYETDNITEDLEVALRIQSHGGIILNIPEAPAYTISPNKFYHLLKQRRRWYVGLMKNMWRYRRMIGSQFGDLGMFVLPVAWISIFSSVVITTYLIFKTLINVREEILFLNSINFDFKSVTNVNFYFFEKFFFQLFTNPVVIFLLMFMFVVGFYLFYASRKIKKVNSLPFSIILFFAFFAVLFGFWWIVSIVYVLFNRKVSWK